MFSAWWTVPFLLALSGAPGFQSFFSFSSAQISLSLSRPFLLQPLAPGVLLVGACVCLRYFHGLDCPSPSHGGLPIGIPAFLSGRSFPPSWWGPALLLRWTSFQSVILVYPGRSLLFLALSSSFCQVLVHCLLSSLWLGWFSASFPASCTRSLSLWPVGCSPVSSVTVPSCVLSLSLSFSIP